MHKVRGLKVLLVMLFLASCFLFVPKTADAASWFSNIFSSQQTTQSNTNLLQRVFGFLGLRSTADSQNGQIGIELTVTQANGNDSLTWRNTSNVQLIHFAIYRDNTYLQEDSQPQFSEIIPSRTTRTCYKVFGDNGSGGTNRASNEACVGGTSGGTTGGTTNPGTGGGTTGGTTNPGTGGGTPTDPFRNFNLNLDNTPVDGQSFTTGTTITLGASALGSANWAQPIKLSLTKPNNQTIVVLCTQDIVVSCNPTDESSQYRKWNVSLTNPGTYKFKAIGYPSDGSATVSTEQRTITVTGPVVTNNGSTNGGTGSGTNGGTVQNPTCSLTSPAQNTTLLPGQTITLGARIGDDPDNILGNVTFSYENVDGPIKTQREITRTPTKTVFNARTKDFTYDWSVPDNIDPGSYKIHADCLRATNNDGYARSSRNIVVSRINVNFQISGQVSSTLETAAGSKLNLDAIINNDNANELKSVDYYYKLANTSNEIYIANRTVSPGSNLATLEWIVPTDFQKNKEYDAIAKFKNGSGKIVISKSVRFKVKTDTQAPTFMPIFPRSNPDTIKLEDFYTTVIEIKDDISGVNPDEVKIKYLGVITTVNNCKDNKNIVSCKLKVNTVRNNVELQVQPAISTLVGKSSIQIEYSAKDYKNNQSSYRFDINISSTDAILLKGIVTDDTTNTPIPRATVRLPRLYGGDVQTDFLGRYTIAIPREAYNQVNPKVIEASAINYAYKTSPIPQLSNNIATVNFQLSPKVITATTSQLCSGWKADIYSGNIRYKEYWTTLNIVLTRPKPGASDQVVWSGNVIISSKAKSICDSIPQAMIGDTVTIGTQETVINVQNSQDTPPEEATINTTAIRVKSKAFLNNENIIFNLKKRTSCIRGTLLDQNGNEINSEEGATPIHLINDAYPQEIQVGYTTGRTEKGSFEAVVPPGTYNLLVEVAPGLLIDVRSNIFASIDKCTTIKEIVNSKLENGISYLTAKQYDNPEPGANVKLIDRKNNTTLTGVTDNEGSSSFLVNTSTVYDIEVSKTGFLPYPWKDSGILSSNKSIKKDKGYVYSYELEIDTTVTEVVINDVKFQFKGKKAHEILQNNRDILNNMANIVNEYRAAIGSKKLLEEGFIFDDTKNQCGVAWAAACAPGQRIYIRIPGFVSNFGYHSSLYRLLVHELSHNYHHMIDDKAVDTSKVSPEVIYAAMTQFDALYSSISSLPDATKDIIYRAFSPASVNPDLRVPYSQTNRFEGFAEMIESIYSVRQCQKYQDNLSTITDTTAKSKLIDFKNNVYNKLFTESPCLP